MCAGPVPSVGVLSVLRFSVPPYVAYALLGRRLEFSDSCQ